MEKGPLHVGLLGPLRLANGSKVIDLRGARPRKLLAMLVLAGGDVVSADRLIDGVWGAAAPSDPVNGLQYHVARLRKLFRDNGLSTEVIVTAAPGYRLNLTAANTDASRFEALLSAGRDALEAGSAADAAEKAEAALALWRGEALADFAYDDFALPEADRLNELRLQGEELALDARIARGDDSELVADLDRLTRSFPYREGLWARLMAVLYRSGRQAEALRVYRRAASLLGDELGIQPGRELRELEERILLQDPTLTPRSQPVRHNLPTAVSSFIGRDHDVAALAEMLGRHRLVTVLGPGGAGKTRLACETARLVLGDYPDGAWFVPLDSLRDPDLVLGAVAGVLGVREQADREMADTVTAFLSNRRLLLVLDNCEHLIEAVAAIVGPLLSHVPELTVLATSQERIQAHGEALYPLAPLAVPGETGSIFDSLDEVPAVQLFLERAQAANPHAVIGEEELAAAANIVTALDGMPLALELAAARSRVLSIPEIAAALGDRFGLLEDASRDRPQRQRTLRSAVEWSVALLDDSDQLAFAQLSVLRGGFDVAATAAVTGLEAAAALRLVDGLLDKSLISRTPISPTARFRMLETLRDFGGSQLDPQAAQEAHGRHTRHFAAALGRASEAILGARQLQALDWIDLEMGNIRSALACALDQRDAASAIRMCSDLGAYWDWRGHVAEAITWLRRVEAIASGAAAPASGAAEPGSGLFHGWFSYFQAEIGERESAAASARRGVAFAEDEDDPIALGKVLTAIAYQARLGGDLAAAADTNRRIIELAAEANYPWLAGWGHNHGVLVAIEQSDAAAGWRHGKLSLQAFRALGDRRGEGWALTAVAQLAWFEGNHEEALDLAWQAVDLSFSLSDQRNTTWSLELIADVLYNSGDHAAAARVVGAAHALRYARGLTASPSHRPELDDLVRRIEEGLGAAAFEQEYSAGYSGWASVITAAR